MPDHPLDLIATSVADGAAVDWDAAESEAPDTATRERVRALRAIAEISNVHRINTETGGAGESPSDVTTIDATPNRARPAAVAESAARWGDLEIRQPLGRGAFGAVYAAYDAVLDREVALKILRPETSTRAQAAVREGRLLARVKHPHVVAVYGADQQGDEVGIRMELIQGHTLADIVERRGPFGAREATLIGIDVCRALAAVHAAGIVHRDIKAQNVMREQGGRTVLTDFGVGRDLGSLDDREDTLSGTPLYLAPELFKGDSGDTRADIYSTGVLLYYLASGDFPVHGRTIDALRRAHEGGKQVLLRDRRPEIPSAFAGCVEKALEPDPENRYQTAGAFASALERALQAQTTGVHTVDVTRVPRLAISRQLTLAAAGMVILALIVAALVTSVGRANAPDRAQSPYRILLVSDEDSSAVMLLPTLRSQLEKQSILTFSDDELRAWLARMRLNHDPYHLGTQDALRLCRRSGAEGVIEIRTNTSGPSLSARTCDGADLGIRQVIQNSRASSLLQDQLAAFSRDLALRIRDSGTPMNDASPHVTTESDEALRIFLSARSAHEHGELERAITLLRAALEKDPRFASAWATLANYLQGSRRFHEAVRATEQAVATSRDLEFAERLSIEAARLRLFRQDEIAERKLSSALDSAPNGEIARLLSMTRYRLLHPVEVILSAARMAKTSQSKDSIARGWFVMMLALAGNLEEADRELDVAREELDEQTYFYWCEGVIHMMRHETAEASRAFEELRKGDPLYASHGSLMQARNFALSGEIDRAQDELLSGIAHDRNRGYIGNEAYRYVFLAEISLTKGNVAQAEEWLRRISMLPAVPEFLFQFRRAAFLYARGGNLSQARALAKRLEYLEKEYPSSASRSSRLLVEAAIHLANGNERRSLERISESEQERTDWDTLRLRIAAEKALDLSTSESSRKLHALRGYIFLEDFPSIQEALPRTMQVASDTFHHH